MRLVLASFLLAAAAVAQTEVTFPSDSGATIYAEYYVAGKDAGAGEHGLVLAHGGRYTKESWKPQAEALARAGFRVLAFDFRGRQVHVAGRGQSRSRTLSAGRALRGAIPEEAGREEGVRGRGKHGRLGGGGGRDRDTRGNTSAGAAGRADLRVGGQSHDADPFHRGR